MNLVTKPVFDIFSLTPEERLELIGGRWHSLDSVQVDRRRLASYFPPSHSRAAGEPDDADNEVTPPEVAAE